MKLLSPLLFVSITLSFAVQTIYFPFFQWERIGEYELSNLTLSSTGNLSFSSSFSTLYTSDVPIWCAIGWKNMLIAGTAEGATLLWISGHSLQSNTFPEHEIISALANDDTFMYVGAIPNTTLYLLNTKREVIEKYPLSPSYLWSIVPSPYGIWLLTGEPAQIYLLRGNKLQKIASLSSERHLLKGIWTEEGLYIMGESSFLYFLSPYSTNIRIAAEFPEPIQDITGDGNSLYLAINRTISRSRRQNGDAEKQEGTIYRYDKKTLSVLTSI
ncbi:MAG: hypothetical protein ACK4TN_04265, partial [Brevinematales bacterium]